MSTPAYDKTIASFARTPLTLIKLTVPGDITGEQVFRFSNEDAPLIQFQIGEDVRPYLETDAGRNTKINADVAKTERARISLTFLDDKDAPEFDSSVFTIFKDGTFWKRIIVSQLDYVGLQIEVLRGFFEGGFVESDFERIFKGRVEDIDMQANGKITVIAKDDLVFIDRRVPGEITDTNVIQNEIVPGDNTFTVSDASEITNPDDFDSKDLFPVVLRLNPEVVALEDVIVKTIDALTDTITLQDNHLNRSEEFDDDDFWIPTVGAVVSDPVELSPFGGVSSGNRLTMAASTDGIEQEANLLADSETVTFSFWARAEGASTTIRIRVEDDLGVGVESDEAIITTAWTRIAITHTFLGGASGNVIVKILRGPGASPSLIYGAQLEQSSARGYYVATEENAGLAPSRAAYGTVSPIRHAPGTPFKEVLIYRDQLTEKGVHPIVMIDDLLNRMELSQSIIDRDKFNEELGFSSSTVFRRGQAAGFTDTTIIESSNISELMGEFRREGLIDLWVGENGLIRVSYSWKPLVPHSEEITFTDEENIITNTLSIKGNAKSRATRMLVYYNVKVRDEANSPGDFNQVSIVFDQTPEVISGKKNKVIFAKNIFRDREALAMAGRTITQFKRPARLLSMSLELKDDPKFFVSEVVRVSSDDILAPGGTSAVRVPTFWKSIQKADRRKQGRIQAQFRKMPDVKCAFIAHVGTPDFPAASDVDKQHAFIGTAVGNEVGSPPEEGYVIC